MHRYHYVKENILLTLSKVCGIEDFKDPCLVDVIRRVYSHELARFGESFPEKYEYRKYWEVAMAVLAFTRTGVIRDDAEILGVGAGNEATIFYLTRFVNRVFGTDLYLNDDWEESANASMLVDPGGHWPFVWNARRLVVQHMDALLLRYENDVFDGVFSSSSIEHFGDDEAINRALDEIHRVLKPGGVAVVSSEYKISGEGNGWQGLRLFGKDDIQSIFKGSRGWDIVDDFDPTISPETSATVQDFSAAAEDQGKQIKALGAHLTHHIKYTNYPHIALSWLDQEWTSFQVVLRKRF